MNCQECEKLILLNEDLSPDEVFLMHEHIKNCQECHDLYAQIQQTNVMIRSAAEFQPVPIDSVRLTDKVMRGVFPPREPENEYVISRWIRYAFAMLSFCAVIVFFSEWQSVPAHESGIRPAAHSPKEASLVSPSVKDIQNKSRQDGFSLYEKMKNNNTRSN